MRTRRPASIRLFALLFLAQAVCSFINGMRHIDREAIYLGSRISEIQFDHDGMIVILSARLSIALIPIALIWFLRAKFARWLVTLMALGGVVNVPEAIAIVQSGGDISPLWLAATVLKPLSVAFLFTRSAHRWFARKDEDVGIFA
ncbi:MAG: hypothetical protein BGO57_02135 [Sphingomonadales bacterium 63-6]|nr:MAG: hypothetical protein BGO57_02135 [Sphingomonadales bacterium 63-6]